jgi:hypothetical protein
MGKMELYGVPTLATMRPSRRWGTRGESAGLLDGDGSVSCLRLDRDQQIAGAMLDA